MSDHLHELLLRDAVLHGVREMKVHLLSFPERDKRSARYQAAIALRKLRPLPDVAEQDVIGKLDELRGQVSQRLAYRARLFLRAHVLFSFVCSSRGTTRIGGGVCARRMHRLMWRSSGSTIR